MGKTKRSPEEVNRALWDTLRASLRASRERGEPFEVGWRKAMRSVRWSEYGSVEMRGSELRALVEGTSDEWKACYEGRTTPTALLFADEDPAARIAECIHGVDRIAA